MLCAVTFLRGRKDAGIRATQHDMQKKKKNPNSLGEKAIMAAPVCRTLPDLFSDQELRSAGLHGFSKENRAAYTLFVKPVPACAVAWGRACLRVCSYESTQADVQTTESQKDVHIGEEGEGLRSREDTNTLTSGPCLQRLHISSEEAL